jgi:serine/threonine protein kinase
VKIGDFGISKRSDDGSAELSTLKGTIPFIAPELHGYGEIRKESRSTSNAQAADMWALGEIAFQILTKEPTFKNVRHLGDYAQNDQVFPSNTLLAHAVSNTGQDFIKCVMLPVPENRLTAAEALRHDWMACYTNHSSRPSSLVSERY